MRFVNFIFLALLFGLVFSASFTLNGTVKFDHNQSLANDVNVTLLNITMTESGSIITTLNSTVTNGSGFFSMVFEDDEVSQYKVVAKYYNSTNENLLYMSQELFAIPASQLNTTFVTLNTFNLSINLLPAAQIKINATNASGSYQNFGYYLKEKKYNTDYGFYSNVTNATVDVLSGRNYTLTVTQFENITGNNEQGSFPRTVVISSSNLTSDVQSDNVYYYIHNLSATNITFTGDLSVTGNSSQVNFSNFVFYPLIDDEFIYCSECQPLNPLNEPGASILNSSTGNFSLVLDSTTSGITYMGFAVGTDGTNFYGAFQNVTATTGTNISFNLTLRPMLGRFIETGYTGDVNKSVFVIQLNSTQTGNISTSEAGMVKLIVNDYNNLGGLNYTIFAEPNSSGHYLIPILNSSNVSYQAFSHDAPPKKGPLDVSGNSTIVQLGTMAMQTPEGSIFSNMNVTFYRSNSTCDVPEPASGCTLAAFSMSSNPAEWFNPLAFIMNGGDVSLKFHEITTGTIVHLYNVDLIASGPPDAQFDSSSNTTSSGGSESTAKRVGSAVPDVYDRAVMSYTYPSTVDDSQNVSAKFTKLYNDTWGEVWNSTDDNDGNNLTAYYNEYGSGKYACLVNASAGGCVCSPTNSSSTCYINTSLNRIWVEVPHFSGGFLETVGSTLITITSSDSSDDKSSFKVEESFDSGTGELVVDVGVVGAEVKLFSTSFGGFLEIVESNEDGIATFEISKSGSYRLQISGSGYLTKTMNLDLEVGLVEEVVEVEDTNEMDETTVEEDTSGFAGGEDDLFSEVQSEIDYAASIIESAESEGKDVSQAKLRLEQAQEAFNSGDYELARELADQSLTLIAEPLVVDEPTTVEVDEPETSLQDTVQETQEDSNLPLIFGGIAVLVIVVIGGWFIFFRK